MEIEREEERNLDKNQIKMMANPFCGVFTCGTQVNHDF